LLARLLLQFFEHLLKLDRTLLLLVVAAPMSACVIPVGPEFQDPPGAPNATPSIASSDPLMGTSTVVATPHFSVTASDTNRGDTITVRWILAYPPWTDRSMVIGADDVIPPAADGRRLRRPSTLDLDCDRVPRDVSTTTRFITAAISDRGFTSRVETPDDTIPAFATWIWEQSCPP
jgi:hypothetical protein